MRVLVVSPAGNRTAARSTLRSLARVAPTLPRAVLDLSSGPAARITEDPVLTLADAHIAPAELHAAALELAEPDLDRWVALWSARRLTTGPAGGVVVLVAAGVEFTSDPSVLADLLEGGTVLVPWATEPPTDGASPGPEELLSRPLFSELISVWAPGAALDTAIRAARDWRTTGRTWEIVSASHRHGIADPRHTLLSAWTLGPDRVVEEREAELWAEGAPVVALDLTALDPDRPWSWDPEHRTWDRVQLSEHPAVAARVRAVADTRRADARHDRDAESTPLFARTADGLPLHPQLRTLYRGRGSDDPLPDPFEPGGATELRALLLAVDPPGHPAPVAHYLAEIYTSRPDLQQAFPLVPGLDSDALLLWAEQHGVHEPDYDAGLLRAAVDSSRAAARPADPTADPTARTEGVAVVGYLAGELGVGESARLMMSALTAGGVPHTAVPVTHQLLSRRNARYAAPDDPRRFTTTLYCVNADQTPGLVRALHGRYDGSYRIGMWYWEVEDFPEDQHVGFDQLDEIWTATDFMRDAISPHTSLPVVTIPPPLPQRPSGRPHGVGLPQVPADRPVFLFAFDFLSNAERKNPWGVVDAFTRAFTPDEGPVLVIKSINAHRDVPSAERLRLLAAQRPDIVLIEDYLDADERDALMARCDAYVSLHRSEGLGLTLAEAMSWGRPVIATAYSGNLQFMTAENSILVPWSPVAVPADCAPYPAGTTWAEPDTAAAARAMRRVLDEPAWAARIGKRAAADVREKHSPVAAAAAITARLAAILGPPGPEAPSRGRQLVGRTRRILRPRS